MKKGIIIFRWIGASIFFLTAMGLLGNKGYIGAMLLLLGGIIILPLNFIVQIRNKLNLKKSFTIILSAILFILGIIVTPITDTQTKSSDNIPTTVVSETINENILDNSSIAEESTMEETSSETSSAQEVVSSSKSNEKENNSSNTTSKKKALNNSTTSENKTSSTKVKNTENSSAKQTTSNISNNKSSQTVYITQTGKKYHSQKNCPGLSNAKSITETTQSEAENMGLAPCVRCH